MLVSLLFLLIGISIGGLITWGYWLRRMYRHKEQMRQYALKVEELTSNYDEYRRKYLDLDDQYEELKSHEQTYRIAYQEWKTKYEGLKNEYTQILQNSSALRKGKGQFDDVVPDDQSLKAELEQVKRALSETTAQVDRQAELIQLHNKQAKRLERLKSQLLELIDHGHEIALKNNIIKRDPSDPRVTDLNDI